MPTQLEELMEKANKKGKRKKNFEDFLNEIFVEGNVQVKCSACKKVIKQEHSVYILKGKVYHDACSQNLKGREKVKKDWWIKKR